MKKNKFPSYFSAVIYSFFILTLMIISGCGRQGMLQAPTGSTYSYPGQYPPED